MKSFDEAWAETGFNYGEDALESVRLGWELKENTTVGMLRQARRYCLLRYIAIHADDQNDPIMQKIEATKTKHLVMPPQNDEDVDKMFDMLLAELPEIE